LNASADHPNLKENVANDIRQIETNFALLATERNGRLPILRRAASVLFAMMSVSVQFARCVNRCGIDE